MEAAAETVRLLTRTILPERPHQLAQSPDWRVTNEERPKRMEEWDHPRLQYMTFVSDGDRGVLFTRNYYDIRPEPPKPMLREVNVLARGGAKKLSLSDYNKKKTTGANTSASPPDTTSSPSLKKSSDRPVPISSDHNQPEESRRSANKPNHYESQSQGSSKSKTTSSDSLADSSLPPKPSSLPPRPPSPERRKRVSDIDDSARPSKRTKPADGPRPVDERLQGREDPLRRKIHDTALSRDQTPAKDGKSAKPSPLTNGRSALKSAANTRPLSPPPRSRETNGGRPGTLENGRGGSIKVDVSSKQSVPPLLSPLRLDLEGNKHASMRKADKERRDTSMSVGKTAKSKTTETQPPAKRPRSPVRVPPLLSPTLPPEVEAELERTKNTSPRGAGSRTGREVLDAPSKARAGAPDEHSADKKSRDSFIVTLKVPKRLRQRFGQYMRLEGASLSRKGPRQDRPGSASGTVLATVSEKRPAGFGEASSLSLATKRPRASDVGPPTRLPPSTPSKKGAPAMSRVSSSGSLARTPGDTANATPSAAPVSLDRVVNGPESLSKVNWSKLQTLKELEIALYSVGKRLKHNGDLSMKGRLEQNSGANGNARASDSNVKLGYVLILESTIAFIMGFHCQDTHRNMAGKASDHNTWLTLFPLLDFLQKDMRRFDEVRRTRPLFTISMVLQVFAYDEMLRAQSTHENPAHFTLQDVLRSRRSRDKLVTQIREATANMDSDMCANITILTTVEEVAEMAMSVIRRWCADERIDYTAELNLKDINIKGML